MSPHLTLMVKIEIIIENAPLKQQQRQKKKWRAAPRVCVYIYTRIGNPLMTTNAVYIHIVWHIGTYLHIHFNGKYNRYLE